MGYANQLKDQLYLVPLSKMQEVRAIDFGATESNEAGVATKVEKTIDDIITSDTQWPMINSREDDYVLMRAVPIDDPVFKRKSKITERELPPLTSSTGPVERVKLDKDGNEINVLEKDKPKAKSDIDEVDPKGVAENDKVLNRTKKKSK